MRHNSPQRKNSKSRFRRAFTLIELLVVITIIGILAGMLAVVYPKVIVWVKENQTRTLILNLTGAIERYKLEYDRAPIASGYNETTEIVFDGSAEGQDLLTALVGEEGTEIKNPRGEIFFNADESNGFSIGIVYDDSGIPTKLLDSWGKPIKMMIDHDYDSKIANPSPSGSSVVRKDSIAWSEGAETKEKENTWENNILSWKK